MAKYLKLPRWAYDWKFGNWLASILVAPGILAIGVYWDTEPLSLHLILPFIVISVERDDQEDRGSGLGWNWFLLRFLIGKQEIRPELTLHSWMLGLKMFETNDYSFHLGPIDIECEYDKHYRDDTMMRPTLRLFSKPNRFYDGKIH